ncbi:bifunctional oligoribonuclease/PAP phosphatase NrnA [Desulfobacterales bacterium HSG16]|nr:bifunctional oligoribonuclease/PAP phosphatase NrnA [Desulfobacterales bacterium HSG16]
MEKIIAHLEKSGRLLVASHVKPDGDALGSLIAAGLCLETMNKQVTFFNESPIPAVYRFLPGVDRITAILEPDNLCGYDTALILDCSDLDRVGEQASSYISQIPVVINVDHHITNTEFGDLQYIDIRACAASQIVYHMIKKMGVSISQDIATSIYTGIFTDTGSFRFSNTNKAAFEICEEMVELGVDPYNVARHVYGPYSLARIKLLNLALDTIEISANGKLSMMTLTRDMLNETGTRQEDVDGLINYARRIEDVKVAVLIQEAICWRSGRQQESKKKKHNYHVSLRSDGSVDVASIAAVYGGGGHLTAAGFNFDSSITDLKDGMLTLANKI